MRVSNRLAGSLANIDPDVVAVRYGAHFDVTPHCRHKSAQMAACSSPPGRGNPLVPARDNQAVAGTQRKGVEKRNGEVVLRATNLRESAGHRRRSPISAPIVYRAVVSTVS